MSHCSLGRKQLLVSLKCDMIKEVTDKKGTYSKIRTYGKGGHYKCPLGFDLCVVEICRNII